MRSPSITRRPLSRLIHPTFVSLLLIVAVLLGLARPSGAGASFPPLAPGVPTRVHAGANAEYATVSWMPPSSTDIPVTGYVVETYIGSATVNVTAVDTSVCTVEAETPTCSARVHNLVAGQTYTFAVRAVNDSGESKASLRSNPIAWHAGITVPDAPPEPSVLASNSAATVTWSAPKDGGSAILGYEITTYFDGSKRVQQWQPAKADATRAVVKDLENGRAYRFTVAAVNAMGWSPESERSIAVTPGITVPGAPQPVSAAADANSIVVSWAAPDNGGSSIDDYIVTAYVGSSSGVVARATILGSALSMRLTPANFPGIVRGQTYTFSLIAENAVGKSRESARSNPAFIAPTVPEAPRDVEAVADHGSPLVSWTAPYDGGSPITSYTVTAYVGTSAQTLHTRTVPGNTTSVRLIGVDRPLFPAGYYTFTVRATNAIGHGAESARSDLLALVAPPTAPLNVRATAGLRTATVSWDGPASDGGSPLTAYIITEYRVGSPRAIATLTVDPGAAGATITGLDPGARYTFTVTAVNALGSGPASQQSDPINLATQPGLPRNIAVVPGPSSALVSWDPPASDGGSTITGYVLTVSDWTHIVSTVTTTATTARVTGLSVDSVYTISVVAVNAVGRSDATYASVRPGNDAPTLSVPADQLAQYGHPFDFAVSATDADEGDHLTLSASGLPAGLTFADSGNGTGAVSGTIGAPAGTYIVTITALDGHNPAVSRTVSITVAQDEAHVVLAPGNPSKVHLGATQKTSGTVTLHATLSGAPGGNIENAAPVTYTLVGLHRHTSYVQAASLTGGTTAGTLAGTARFHRLPVDVYRVQLSVGGRFYHGASEGMLSVYQVGRDAIATKASLNRSGNAASLQVSARYLANGRLSGTFLYDEQRAGSRQILKSVSMDSMVVIGKHVYILGKATLNRTDNDRFVLTLDGSGRGRAGLWLLDPAGSTVGDLTFLPQALTAGRITVTRK